MPPCHVTSMPSDHCWSVAFHLIHRFDGDRANAQRCMQRTYGFTRGFYFGQLWYVVICCDIRRLYVWYIYLLTFFIKEKEKQLNAGSYAIHGCHGIYLYTWKCLIDDKDDKGVSKTPLLTGFKKQRNWKFCGIPSPSPKLTASTWKMVIGRQVSFLGMHLLRQALDTTEEFIAKMRFQMAFRWELSVLGSVYLQLRMPFFPFPVRPVITIWNMSL